ncbi:MAG: type II secretion system minor pseudopilin GspK [Halieaceae bacterium]
MRCRRFNYYAPGSQSGAALVVAMLVFAICAALIVAMQREFILFYQRGANNLQAEQGYAYLRGAEELATLALVLDYDTDKQRDVPRDDLEEIWAQPPTPYALDEGGWLMGGLEDLQGRFNLNSLAGAGGRQDDGQAQGSERFTPAQAQFIRLLQTLEEPIVSQQEAIAITRSVGDWIDADSNTSPDGAEDDFYFSQTPPYRAANRPMSSVSELRAIANVTPEIYAVIAPMVTVWPQAAQPLNIHTAPAQLLRSINADDLLEPLSEADAQALVEQREESGFLDKAEFLAHPAFTDKPMDKMAELLGESSGYFLLSARVEIADRELQLYSVLQRQQRRVESLVRASGSL